MYDWLFDPTSKHWGEMPKILVWARAMPDLRYRDRTQLGVIKIFYAFFFWKHNVWLSNSNYITIYCSCSHHRRICRRLRTKHLKILDILKGDWVDRYSAMNVIVECFNSFTCSRLDSNLRSGEFLVFGRRFFFSRMVVCEERVFVFAFHLIGDRQLLAAELNNWIIILYNYIILLRVLVQKDRCVLYTHQKSSNCFILPSTWPVRLPTPTIYLISRCCWDVLLSDGLEWVGSTSSFLKGEFIDCIPCHVQATRIYYSL